MEKFGLTKDEVSTGDGTMSTMAEFLLGEGILPLAEARYAGTIADVTVRGREKAGSKLATDRATDVATAVVQAPTPPRFFSRAARATVRNAPVWWATLVRDGDQVRPTCPQRRAGVRHGARRAGDGSGDAEAAASGITPDQFAASIVTARSRVLHGTWPTLHSILSMPDDE